MALLPTIPYHVYQPPANMPHYPVTITSLNTLGYSIRSNNPNRHWRPQLSSLDLAQMGLQNFIVHYSSFTFAPSRWRLEAKEPLSLGKPMNCYSGITNDPGIIILQDVVDFTRDGELVVFGWNLNKYGELTTHSRGFFAAVDFVIPYHLVQLPASVRFICSLPLPLAQYMLRMRHRCVIDYMKHILTANL